MNRRRTLSSIVIFCLLLISHAAWADPCRYEIFEGNAYTVCSFDVTENDMRMFWRNGSGDPYKTFSALAEDLSAQGKDLVFAMNGGMYQTDHSPLGLYVEDGEVLKSINTTRFNGEAAQVPNFYKKPNGVFYLAPDHAGILETEAFLALLPDRIHATQSGPMLLLDGEIHPDFIKNSRAIRPRNGVGLSSPTRVHFAMSRGFVNFHDFARFFRDSLGCEQALYLDGGSASGLYSPALNRNDPPGHGGYGPIIAVIKQPGTMR